MTLQKRIWLAGEEAAWLADKIVATSEYGNDAARLLRLMSYTQEENAKLREELNKLALTQEELNTLLAKAREEGRKEAVQDCIVAIEESQPPETTPWDCVEAIRNKIATFAAAPKPEVKS